MKREYITTSYFYGNKCSDYAIKEGYVDYATLSKAFDAVLNNSIMAQTEGAGLGYWEQVNGYIDNSEELEEIADQIAELEEQAEEAEENEDSAKADSIRAEIEELEDRRAEIEEDQNNPGEIFQYYIISDNGAEILQEWTNEIIYYNAEIDMYIWGVTHYGTGWAYVLTDIEIRNNEGREE